MNPEIKAYVAVMRAGRIPPGLTKREILQIAKRYRVDQDKLGEAVLSGDSFNAAEILGVDAAQLNEAVHFYVLTEEDEVAFENAPAQTERTGHLDEKIAPLLGALPIEKGFREALQTLILQWPEPEDREEVSRRVTDLGAVETVRSAINEIRETDEFVSLWASDRLDLTLEALALCPAWKDLFLDDEKDRARSRLHGARTMLESSEDRPARSARDTWVFWMDGRPVGASQLGYEDPAAQSPTCEMFAHTVDAFAETGQFGASLRQRRHYRICKRCSKLSTLAEIVGLVDKEAFRRLRILFSTMPIMLQGPLCWETVTLLAFIDRNCDVDPEVWVAARQGEGDEVFSNFVRSLDRFEFFGLLLARKLGKMFGPPALACHSVLFLPSDLGFPTEPGVVNTKLSAEDWARFRETEDAEAYGARPGGSIFDDVQTNFRDLMFLAGDATNHLLQTLWKGKDDPEYLVRAGEQDQLNRRLDRKDPNRIAAASLRTALGDGICNSLCIEAYTSAVQAERIFLEANPLLGGDLIVTALVRAFEHQLDYLLIDSVERKPLKGSGLELTIAKKAQLIHFPDDPKLQNRAKDLGVDLTSLSNILCRFRVVDIRNRVSHPQEAGYTLAEAEKVRRQWFGLELGDGGIFAVVAPPRLS